MAQRADTEYRLFRIEPGDTLWQISIDVATAQGVELNGDNVSPIVHEIARLNNIPDPDRILPGQIIIVAEALYTPPEPEAPDPEPEYRIPANPARSGPLRAHMMTKGPRVVRDGVAIPYGWTTGNGPKHNANGPGTDFLRNQAQQAKASWNGPSATHRTELWPEQDGPRYQCTIPLGYGRGSSARRQWKGSSLVGLFEILLERFDHRFRIQFARGAAEGVPGDLRIGHEPKPWYGWNAGFDQFARGSREVLAWLEYLADLDLKQLRTRLLEIRRQDGAQHIADESFVGIGGLGGGERPDLHNHLAGGIDTTRAIELLADVYETGNRGPLYRETFRHVAQLARPFELDDGRPAFTVCFNDADPKADPGTHGDTSDTTAGQPDDLSRDWNDDSDPGAYHPETNPGGADTAASDYYWRSGATIQDFDNMLALLERRAVLGGYQAISFCEFGLFVHENPDRPYPGANHDQTLAPRLRHSFERFTELADRGVLDYISWWESLKTPTKNGNAADYQLFKSTEPKSWAVLAEYFPNT